VERDRGGNSRAWDPGQLKAQLQWESGMHKRQKLEEIRDPEECGARGEFFNYVRGMWTSLA